GAVLALASTSTELQRSARTAGDGTIYLRGSPPQSGISYTVTAYVPQPSAAAMRAAPRRVPAAYLPYTELELPGAAALASPIATDVAAGAARIAASPYARVFALAHRLAVGAGSSYDVARRIEAYLRRGFSYDEHPPRRAYPLAAFLLEDRRGYCQQFSGAMALLLRMDGIPARVAAGFQAGTHERGSGRFLVSAHDAHSWVEVYFAGIGWVAFDPTPAVGSSGGSGAGAIERAEGLGGAFAAQRQGARARRAHGRGARRATSLTTAAAHRGAGAKQVGMLAMLALALIVLMGLWRWILRLRRPLRGARQGAVTELVGAMRALGIEIGGATTLAELETRLQGSHGCAAADYVRLLRDRRYAPEPDTERPNARDRRLLRRALCTRRGALVRLRALQALPPLVPWKELRRIPVAQRDT
ncbi:MAG TPA: transglutaminase-like domain-containing protein, partial [Solirubrobacteraceae bacterium]